MLANGPEDCMGGGAGGATSAPPEPRPAKTDAWFVRVRRRVTESTAEVHTLGWQLRVAEAALPTMVGGYADVGSNVPRVAPGTPLPTAALSAEGAERWLTGTRYGQRVVNTLRYGADLCFEGALPMGRHANCVEEQYDTAVRDKLLEEVQAGVLAVIHDRVLEQYSDLFRVSNAIVRAVQEPTKIRKIHDMSAKRRIGGALVRTGINAAVNLDAMGECPLHTVQDVGDAIMFFRNAAGVVPLLASYDFKSAFRQFAVRSVDIPAQLVIYDGVVMWDTRLGMGHRASAHTCAQFSAAVAEAVEKLMCGTVRVLRYMDDLLLIGHPSYISAGCDLMERVLGDIGMAVSTSKTVAPTTRAKYIGFTHDSVECNHGIPAQKMYALLLELRRHTGVQTAAQQRDTRKWQSLAGKLADVTKVLTAGRPFLRHIFDAISNPNTCDWAELRQDVLWWLRLLPTLDSVAHMRAPPPATAFTVEVDASLWGGAVVVYPAGERTGGGAWWWKWPAWMASTATSGDMPLLEAITVLAAVRLVLGGVDCRRVRRGLLAVRSDCEGVVFAVRGASSRNRGVARVLRSLFALLLQRDVQLLITHVYSAQNTADGPSRLAAPDGNRGELDVTCYNHITEIRGLVRTDELRTWRSLYRGASGGESACFGTTTA